MRKLLLAIGAGITLVIAIIAIIALAEPASGENGEQSIAPSTQKACGFGYVDLLATKERVCVPTLFEVQPSDTLTGIAGWMGSYSSWERLCRYHDFGDALVISLPGDDPRSLLPGEYVGGCPRNHHDLASVGLRIKKDRHRPSSMDA